MTRIERMGRFLGVVTGNFVHNLLRPESEPSYFERTVVSDDSLTEHGRDQFLALSAERGQELMEDLDSFLTGLAADERTASGKKYGVGVYFFEENVAKDSEKVGHRSGITDVNDDRKAKGAEEIDVLAIMRRKE